MEENKEGKAEKTFKSFGQRVDAFVAELNEASARLEKEFEEKYNELKDSADRMKKEVENKERWKDVESSLKKAGDELKNAFHAAFKKKPSDNDKPNA